MPSRDLRITEITNALLSAAIDGFNANHGLHTQVMTKDDILAARNNVYTVLISALGAPHKEAKRISNRFVITLLRAKDTRDEFDVLYKKLEAIVDEALPTQILTPEEMAKAAETN